MKPKKLAPNKDGRLLVSNNSPYQQLYEKPLTKEQLKEIKFNLVSFVELLIKLDQQQKSGVGTVVDNHQE